MEKGREIVATIFVTMVFFAFVTFIAQSNSGIFTGLITYEQLNCQIDTSILSGKTWTGNDNQTIYIDMSGSQASIANSFLFLAYSSNPEGGYSDAELCRHEFERKITGTEKSSGRIIYNCDWRNEDLPTRNYTVLAYVVTNNFDFNQYYGPNAAQYWNSQIGVSVTECEVDSSFRMQVIGDYFKNWLGNDYAPDGTVQSYDSTTKTVTLNENIVPSFIPSGNLGGSSSDYRILFTNINKPDAQLQGQEFVIVSSTDGGLGKDKLILVESATGLAQGDPFNLYFIEDGDSSNEESSCSIVSPSIKFSGDSNDNLTITFNYSDTFEAVNYTASISKPASPPFFNSEKICDVSGDTDSSPESFDCSWNTSSSGFYNINLQLFDEEGNFISCAGGNGKIEILSDASITGPVCGNGVIEGLEQCDGLNLGGNVCQTVGSYSGGTLACTSDCRFDRTLCTENQIPIQNPGINNASNNLISNNSNEEVSSGIFILIIILILLIIGAIIFFLIRMRKKNSLNENSDEESSNVSNIQNSRPSTPGSPSSQSNNLNLRGSSPQAIVRRPIIPQRTN